MRKQRITKKGMGTRKYNSHHITPRSRGGGNEDNLVRLPIDFHDCLHKLFQNLTLSEIHSFLDIVLQPHEDWTWEELNHLIERLKEGRNGYVQEEG